MDDIYWLIFPEKNELPEIIDKTKNEKFDANLKNSKNENEHFGANLKNENFEKAFCGFRFRCLFPQSLKDDYNSADPAGRSAIDSVLDELEPFIETAEAAWRSGDWPGCIAALRQHEDGLKSAFDCDFSFSLEDVPRRPYRPRGSSFEQARQIYLNDLYWAAQKRGKNA